MKTSLLLKPIVPIGAAVALFAAIVGCSTFTNMRGNTQYGADKHLAGQVQDALKKDALYKYPNVSVSVYRGDVNLGGTINQENQRAGAIRAAESVPGVLSVKDNMVVNTNPPVAPE